MSRHSELDLKAALREKALRLLSRREYSRQELEHKLAAVGAEKDEIAALLDEFAEKGWLSEKRFAEQAVRARAGRYGNRRIRHELLEKGVTSEVVDAELAKAGQNDLDVARALWQRKFGSVPSDEKEKTRQIRFLQARGFGYEVIRKVIQGAEDDFF